MCCTYSALAVSRASASPSARRLCDRATRAAAARKPGAAPGTARHQAPRDTATRGYLDLELITVRVFSMSLFSRMSYVNAGPCSFVLDVVNLWYTGYTSFFAHACCLL